MKERRAKKSPHRGKEIFGRAETLLEEAQKSLQAAHHFQTDLIQGEMQEDGEPVEVRLLMVHGQDHLMDAMVVSDLEKKNAAGWKGTGMAAE